MDSRNATGPLNKVLRGALGAAAAFLLSCGIAHATIIFSGTVSVSAGDPTQMGRPSRNGQPQDWTGSEPFPGVFNPTLSYHYTTIDLDLSSLEAGFVFGGFLQIDFDSLSPNTFLSAYLNSYDPTDPGATWLGDTGFSGNAFGTDPLFFQVIAGATDHLILVLNETIPGGGLDMPGDIIVEAFTDTEFTDLVRTAPEPSTLAILACGLMLLMASRRSAARGARS